MRASTPSYLAFAAFGLFWGTWGAALPALREQAGVDDGELGFALLFVGLGALPAMLVTGRAVDRFGARIAGVLLVALAAAGVVVGVTGIGLAGLAVGMALVGATSGAADVAANALAGLAEQRSGRRTITVAHGSFSSFVVVGSLGASVLAALGASTPVVFAVSGSLMVAAAVPVLLRGDRAERVVGLSSMRASERPALPLVLIGVGLVGALGFAAENAHQSWSAIFLADELDAPAVLTGLAPATFATFAALTRFAAGRSTRVPTGALLIGGAVVAVLGTLLLSIADGIPVALAGLALAAIGTSVLFPTLLSRATRDVPAATRGRATSAISTTAYLGFVLGPVFVGGLAHVVGLPGAMVGVAVLIILFAVLSPAVTRGRTPLVSPTG